MNIFLTLISTILLSLAFPKFDLHLIAWIAIVPFLFAIDKCSSSKNAGRLGLIFGLVFLGINLSWITILKQYVGYYAYIGWFALIFSQSVFFLIFSYFSKLLNINLTVRQAFLWVAIEILRGIGPFGFGGGVLAYSQTNLLPLIQISSIFTAYGVSFIIILFNISIAKILLQKSWKLLLISTILILVSVHFGDTELKNSWKPAPTLRRGGFLTDGRNLRINFAVPSKRNRFITVSIIQGNIPQERKLSSIYNQEIFDIHKELTHSALKDKPDLIIWPETAVFTYLLHDEAFLKSTKDLIAGSNAYFLIGTPHYDESMRFFNSVVAFSPSGKVLGRYDKQHLVPFGEYLPFKQIMYPLLKNTNYFGEDFSPGPESSPIKLSGIKIGAVVCFESTFPFLVMQRVQQGADILVVLTNDAWFKDSSAAYEHFDQAIFRAIENRKYLLQAANTGISAVIDPYGRIINKLELNQRGHLTSKVPLP